MKNIGKILVTTATVLILILSCINNNKQKELELKEKELALIERELALKEKDTIPAKKEIISPSDKTVKANQYTRDDKTVEKKCGSKNQLSGKLMGATYDMCGLRMHIITNKGEEWINIDNYDVKIDNQRLFKWSNSKIKNYIDDVDNWDSPFPSDAIDIAHLNKQYVFCCKKKPLECGDDPSATADYCTQIFTQ